MVKKIIKKQKDPNAPRKNISAYFIFNRERRVSLRKEEPLLSNRDLVKKMSVEWNRLPDEQKKIYAEKAEADKKRYEAEKLEYEKNKKTK